MKSIEQLSSEEQTHFIQCSCGDYIDMRNLQEVFHHQHLKINSKIAWDYSVKIGEPVAYTKEGLQIKLN